MCAGRVSPASRRDRHRSPRLLRTDLGDQLRLARAARRQSTMASRTGGCRASPLVIARLDRKPRILISRSGATGKSIAPSARKNARYSRLALEPRANLSLRDRPSRRRLRSSGGYNTLRTCTRRCRICRKAPMHRLIAGGDMDRRIRQGLPLGTVGADPPRGNARIRRSRPRSALEIVQFRRRRGTGPSRRRNPAAAKDALRQGNASPPTSSRTRAALKGRNAHG